MKQYNCPDCSIDTNSCTGCPRISNKEEFVDWSNLNIKSFNNVPEACRHCSTHPSNGGNGICCCMLGSYYITC